MVLVILAVIWAAVLLPPYLQNRSESRPADSISTFRNQLSVLERRSTDASSPGYDARPRPRHDAPPRRLRPGRSGPASPGWTPRSAAATSSSRCWPPPASPWSSASSCPRSCCLHLVIDVLLGAYVALLVRQRRLAEERAMKVRYLRPPAGRPPSAAAGRSSRCAARPTAEPAWLTAAAVADAATATRAARRSSTAPAPSSPTPTAPARSASPPAGGSSGPRAARSGPSTAATRRGAAALAAEAEAALREAQAALAPVPGRRPRRVPARRREGVRRGPPHRRCWSAAAPLPGPDDLGVQPTSWLRGLAEAASELRRHLLDRLRDGELDRGEELLAAMDDAYDALVTVDFPDAVTGGLRRTVDALRAVLERTRGDVTTTVLQTRLRDAARRRLRRPSVCRLSRHRPSDGCAARPATVSGPVRGCSSAG